MSEAAGWEEKTLTKAARREGFDALRGVCIRKARHRRCALELQRAGKLRTDPLVDHALELRGGKRRARGHLVGQLQRARQTGELSSAPNN